MFMILTCNIDKHLYLQSESSIKKNLILRSPFIYTCSKCVVYKFWLSLIKINAKDNTYILV